MQNDLDFIVVGPPRTGSTWLHKVLSTHKSIFVPNIKQLHYFDRDYVNKTKEEYLSHFHQKKTCHQSCGDITPDYVSQKLYLKRISNDFPEIKIILIYRNPIDRAFSHYKVRKLCGKIKGGFVENFESDPFLMKNSLYGNHLENIMLNFTDKQILILDYALIQNSPNRFIHHIEDFLNVVKSNIDENLLYSKVSQSSKSSIIKSFFSTKRLDTISIRKERLCNKDYVKLMDLIKSDHDKFKNLNSRLNSKSFNL
jgi:hypothetical protein